MKRLFILAIGFLSLAFSTEAAPPLRGIVPMKLADGTMTMPIAFRRAPQADMLQCAPPMSIANSNYLPHTGNVRVLTILAAFQDLDFIVNNPVQAFDQYLNGEKQENLGNMNHGL